MTARTSISERKLKYFAQIVDIVDGGIFSLVRSLVCMYVTHEPNSEYFELLRSEAAGTKAST